MAKNLVFCADGTWNGPGEAGEGLRTGSPTNVFKLFANLEGLDSPASLRLADEQERRAADAADRPVQLAKYLHGVGDSENPLVKFLGGAFGAGLIARVVRGYTFLSRNYEAGDAIYLVGFSRGAYTARALAGLVAKQGLMDASRLDLADKEAAYRWGSAVWYRHQQSLHDTFMGRLQSFVADLPGFLSRPPGTDQLIRVPLRAVAVWDTVGAMGIPAFAADHERLDLFRFADTKLSPRVACGLHAVSVDEIRQDFDPTLWDPDPRIVQALFPGAHADVGGGYPAGSESGLSDGALAWMQDRLAEQGLRFAALPAWPPAPSATGIAHRPWAHFPWTHLPTGARALPAGLRLHRSVLDRMAGGPVAPDPGVAPEVYAPGNLGAYVAQGEAKEGVVMA
ncbi:hypothetical protein GETHPA_12720 [Geothrix rubra]|uniref:T6SS Phospholipase effector Tle1-like catalytic domain-containing protein n=1 Tax=Geothrix rubra TaxID=2927977 RepID=A0ABQ5Q5G0_9BACT|nr:DUF2235 domain-containing protein [Geothrix rubra]GLH69739.1 hypothetical protein GETHPA_12720 [Geothrix rubra]